MYIYLNLYVFITGRPLLPPDGHLSQFIILKYEIKLYCIPFKQEICITVHTIGRNTGTHILFREYTAGDNFKYD